MRYLFGFICVLALGVIGCSETAGTGGSGGTAGTGGTECEVPADCPGDLCTKDGQEDCVGGVCTYEPLECHDDINDCTADPACDPAVGCAKPPVADGTLCAGGTCQAGVCALTGSVLPCSVQGIRNAIAAGGDEPYTFDCGGPQALVLEGPIGIDNDVILDGEGNLTLDGNDEWVVFELVEADVTAELRGFTVTRGGVWDPNIEGWVAGAIANQGTLTLTDTTVSENIVGVDNTGTLTLTNCAVSGTRDGWSIGSNSTLTLTNSTVSGSAGEEGGGVFISGGTVTLLNSTVSDAFEVRIDDRIPGPSAIVSTATLIDGACTTAAGSMVTWASNGHNVESPGDTCGFDQGTDLVNITEGQLDLDPLADNGGPTMTHALGAGSVALDHIPEIDCEVDEDQRGVARPQGPACDVGAFELEVAP